MKQDTVVISHPLQPLSEQEVQTVVAATKAAERWSERSRFSTIALVEPDKAVTRSWKAGSPMPERLAKAVVYDRASQCLSEVVVCLTSADKAEVRSWTPVPGAQPPLMLEEYLKLAEVVKADPRILEALKRRGVTDVTHLQVDPWPPGNMGEDVDKLGKRMGRALLFLRDFRSANGYAKPVDNLVAYVDYDTWEVIEVQDVDPVRPFSKDEGRYDAPWIAERQPLRKPAALEITQPDGPGFTIEDGHAVSWERWRLRVSTHPVEGPVIHDVRWVDGHGDDMEERPILFRLNLSEMVVPYGSPSKNSYRKCAFDAGECGLAKLLNTLSNGCDCLGEIRYLSQVTLDEDGNTGIQPNVICVHEEDYGLAWKHYDLISDTAEVRRQRRLVINSIATVGNYEYIFRYLFYLDGTIEVEIKMTGILQTECTPPGELSAHSVMISEGLAAPHHQHLFCVRIDWDVDGGPNTVIESDIVPTEAGPANPYNMAITNKKTVLSTEKAAQRMIDAAASRTWVVENRSKTTSVGVHPAYKLKPGYSPTLLAAPGSAVHRRATFATKSLWVTPFDPKQMHPAGDYPYQHPGNVGIAQWTEADRSVEDTDVVMWHVFGASHVARPEDWPVMPSERLSCKLVPWGFFPRNPCLDLAPPAKKCAGDKEDSCH